MDYEEKNFSDNRKKFSTSLIVTITVAIIIIAGAAWFAISRYNDTSKITKINPSSSPKLTSDIDSVASDIKEEYEDITSSYNDIVSDVESKIEKPVESVAQTGDKVSSVPYSTNFCKPVEGEILTEFSDKQLQYSKTFGDMRMHYGVDILCGNGTSVSACGDGKIINIEESGHYGTVLTMELGNGLTAKYSSLADIKFKIGDTVKAGDIIGVASTIPAECNDPEHIHLEVYKNNKPVDPLKALGF